ncbi:MAG: LAGLIDADG family homing endonuclease [Patescibacteria group bacterium]|jgi:hypothetical protein
MKKYLIDENFFNNIDTQDKSYFLGILYADGCHKIERNEIELQLSGQDVELLIKLRDLIFYEPKPFYTKKSKTIKICGIETTRQESNTLSICNKNISKSLLTHGLIKNKSSTIDYPDFISDELQSHFIRGYFDGDGSVFLTRKRQISIAIIGSELFCLKLQSILKQKEIKSSMCKAGNSTKVKSLEIHGNKSGRKFLLWIYSNASLYLQRKFLKVGEILDTIPKEKPTNCSICSNKNFRDNYCKQHYYEFIGRELRHKRYIEKEK